MPVSRNISKIANNDTTVSENVWEDMNQNITVSRNVWNIRNGQTNAIVKTSKAKQARQIVLDKHRIYRSMHGLYPNIEDEELNRMAQNYAEFMATSGKFGPSNASEMGLGENIYGLEASYPATSCIVEHILDLWYYEIHNYNFRQPNNQSYSDVRHFTQMVWSTSIYIGTGYVKVEDGDWFKCYLVCYYRPKGNIVGMYGFYVPPLLRRYQHILSPSQTEISKSNIQNPDIFINYLLLAILYFIIRSFA